MAVEAAAPGVEAQLFDVPQLLDTCGLVSVLWCGHVVCVPLTRRIIEVTRGESRILPGRPGVSIPAVAARKLPGTTLPFFRSLCRASIPASISRTEWLASG